MADQDTLTEALFTFRRQFNELVPPEPQESSRSVKTAAHTFNQKLEQSVEAFASHVAIREDSLVEQLEGFYKQREDFQGSSEIDSGIEELTG